MSKLRLRGLRAGNLQSLDLELPVGRWSALHGPSGSGKTALLFGVLESVARRRFRLLHDPRALPSGHEAWLTRLADEVEGLQPCLSVNGEIPRGRRLVEVGQALDLWRLLADAWLQERRRRCPQCATKWRAPDVAELVAASDDWPESARVHLYSFAGGEDASELLRAGWTRVQSGGQLARLEECDDSLGADAWLLLDRFRWDAGRVSRLQEALQEAVRRSRGLRIDLDGDVQEHAPAESCPECGHTTEARLDEDLVRLRDAPELVVGERCWNDWASAPFAEWSTLPVAADHPGLQRVAFLERTGLGHLDPCRTLGTLSLGESRRLELVALLGQVRRDQLVLFDEPGMGLHGSERRELASLFRELVQQGNTVLTADPAREFIQAADEWVQLGPGGGPEGGRIVGRGTRRKLPAEPSWDPPEPAPIEDELVFRKCRHRFVDVPKLSLPMGRVVAIAGVSGSGKSTLLDEVLVPRLREERDFKGKLPDGGVAVLLERALGHAAISTIATLSGAWGEIRRAFAESEEARIRGLSAGHFTALPDKGACPACRGHGRDEDHLPCTRCNELGLREDLLEVRLRGRSLREWLTTPIVKLERRLPHSGRLGTLAAQLVQLGLGERTFGERGRRLSLGERSRIALARALASARRGRPKLFLLDEPCLGLPFTEARRVVDLLRSLAAEGHSFWVVEHHEVLLRSADWMVELGPGAGPQGGQLLFEGPPSAVENADTPTGSWLRSRQEALPPVPRAPRRKFPASEALPDTWERQGRQQLEADLQRELATRSPLLADQWPLDESSRKALPPTAWPAEAPDDAALLDVLGVRAPLREAVLTAGVSACVHCGGAGPFRHLEGAVRSASVDGTAVYSAPIALPDSTREQQTALLRAAGFRRVVRAGAAHDLSPKEPVAANDEVWLDEFSASGGDAADRWRDVEHHSKLIGGGHVVVRQKRREFRYRKGACRDCHRGEPSAPAAMQPSLAGKSIEALESLPLGEALEHLQANGALVELGARVIALLDGSSVLRRAGRAAQSGLTVWERKLARLSGLVLFPLPGVVLLHDQPLSGLPATIAQRLAAALLEPEHGAHRFTDPEGWTRKLPAPDPDAFAEPFNTEWNPAEWGEPVPAPGDSSVRAALGLTESLRQHFLRTEAGRLRGWTRADLAAPRGRVCAECRGSGGNPVHPHCRLVCPECRGSGWSRETAVLEDRGLRWNDLAANTLADLATHFGPQGRIGSTLALAVDWGLGAVRLDERLERLPWGARVLLPVLALCAENEPPEVLRLAAPATGLSALEAGMISSRMRGYFQTLSSLEWKDHHPRLLSRPH